MTYYARERIGPKQSLTPEGFLLCEETPIARTGQMLYGAGEVPITPSADGTIIIDRHPEDVFRPETLASFNGKDLVDEHPQEDVAPHNWRELTAGVVLNVRRGQGVSDDLVLADLLVKDPDVIQAIRNGKRELSLGYQADYLALTAADGVTPLPGRGRQINIIGNHCALVSTGRCGPRCAIGDEQTIDKGENMSWIDSVKSAFAKKDEAALDAALAQAPKGETITLTTAQLKALNHLTHDGHGKGCDCADCMKTRDGGLTKDAVVDAVFADKRFTDLSSNVARIADAFEKETKKEEEEEEEEDDDNTEDNEMILGDLEMEAPPGTGDGAFAKAKDSVLLEDSWQETVSLAEIIAPGIQVPTFDAKADPKRTGTALCRFRRAVLDAAALQSDTHTFIHNTTGGHDYKKFTCDATRTLYRAVGQFRKNANNAAASRDNYRGAPEHSGDGNGAVGVIRTPADLNKRMAEIYKM